MSALQGVLHGGRTGAQLGAIVGPWGAAAGAVAGAVIGGVAFWWLGDQLASHMSNADEQAEEQLDVGNVTDACSTCEPPEEDPEEKIDESELNDQQKRNLSRFKKKLPKDAGPVRITRAADGTVRFTSDVPARNIPGSFARYQKSINPSGTTSGYTKTTFGSDGRVVHTKKKF